MNSFKHLEARCIQYELSIAIQASVPRVWKAITGELSRWWLPSFHMLGESSIVSLEPHAGGRLYETLNQSELLWYSVLAIEPQKSLTMSGFISPQFGGPATSILTLDLRRDSDATHLGILDALYGNVSESMVRSLHAGWIDLFSNGLKPFVESNDINPR